MFHARCASARTQIRHTWPRQIRCDDHARARRRACQFFGKPIARWDDVVTGTVLMSNGITMDARHNSPQEVAGVLREHGCVLLRNALPRRPVLVAGEAVKANAGKLKELLG